LSFTEGATELELRVELELFPELELTVELELLPELELVPGPVPELDASEPELSPESGPARELELSVGSEGPSFSELEDETAGSSASPPVSGWLPPSPLQAKREERTAAARKPRAACRKGLRY
jgi:hypothetical protein